MRFQGAIRFGFRRPVVSVFVFASCFLVTVMGLERTAPNRLLPTVEAQGSCTNVPPPVVPTSVTFSALFGERIIYKLPVNQVAGDTLTYALSDSSAGGPTASNLDTKTGILLYQPFLVGKVTFTLSVTNCKGDKASTPLTINVNPNPARPKIINLRFRAKDGLVMQAAESSIRLGATLQIRPSGSSPSANETFDLEFKERRRKDNDRSVWIVQPDAKSRPGGKNIQSLIRTGQTYTVVVVSDTIPSEPAELKR